MSRNDFMTGFLQGLYNSGLGNPQVQQQNQALQQQQDQAKAQQMSEAGMVATPGTLPSDHPVRAKIGSFINSMFGGGGGSSLARAYQPDPTRPTFSLDAGGKTAVIPPGQLPPEGQFKFPGDTSQALGMLKSQATKSSAPSRLDAMTPQQKEDMAKAVYEGNVDVRTMGFRERTELNILANEYALKNNLPAYKSYTGQVRGKTAEAFTTGKFGQNINSLNTALGHVESVHQAYQDISNTDQAWLNTPINKLKKSTNDPNVVKLGISLNALRGELATTFKGSGGTDQEIGAWKDYLSENLTPDQAYSALNEIDGLLRSRQQALEYQRSTGMAQSPGETALVSPKAAKTRTSLAHSPLGNRQKPKTVIQNGHTYTLNSLTGKYE